MSFLKPGPPSRKQIERRERIRLKGRNRYIVVRGILGWGMTTFLLTSIWRLVRSWLAASASRGTLFPNAYRIGALDGGRVLVWVMGVAEVY
jgi:hypothetical protein